METKPPVETLETSKEVTGSPSEGSGERWEIFSSSRPHQPTGCLAVLQITPSAPSVCLFELEGASA